MVEKSINDKLVEILEELQDDAIDAATITPHPVNYVELYINRPKMYAKRIMKELKICQEF